MAKGFEEYVFSNLKSNGFYHNYDIRHFPKEKLPLDIIYKIVAVTNKAVSGLC